MGGLGWARGIIFNGLALELVDNGSITLSLHQVNGFQGILEIGIFTVQGHNVLW